ncbi:MAG: hypothetical protein WCK78_04320 [Paludibacter sp.]
MFVGTTPPEIRTLLQDLMQGTKGRDVFIGCSGNFTVDKVMSKMGYDVHSNDVSLYSKLISDILLETNTELKIVNPELINAFDSWEEHKYKKLIQVMYAIRLAEFAPRKNEYQQSFFDSWIEQSAVYYHNTIEKLEKGAFDFSIKSFHFYDFVEFLKQKQGKGVGISFPPTYKAGYEKIFDYVEKSFDYERAHYDMFDPKNGDVVFKELLETDENVIYSDKQWESLAKYETGVVRLGAGKHPVFIYSSIEKDNKYYFERDKKAVDSKLKILPADYEFLDSTVITVELCAMSDINYFKAFYMANKVNYTTGGDLGLVFMADGKAFGFSGYSKMLSTTDLIFAQSDFVTNSNSKKLSKLLIMLSLSSEVRMLIARKMLNYYDGIKTTVYTDNAVSMKYRGVYELERRDKGKLIYVGKFTKESLNDIYRSWLKKNYQSKQEK